MFSSLFLLLSSPFSFVVALVVVLVIVVVVVEFLLILFLLPLSNKNDLLLLLLLFPYDVDAVNEESARMMLEAMVDASRRAREWKTQSEEGKKMRARLAVFKKNEEFVKEKNKEKNLHFFFGFCGSCVYSELTVVVTTRVG
tara:strand:+ start:2748 stop:3170 length:423 start_codon:yes stop_codon:yes gene_type:complete